MSDTKVVKYLQEFQKVVKNANVRHLLILRFVQEKGKVQAKDVADYVARFSGTKSNLSYTHTTLKGMVAAKYLTQKQGRAATGKRNTNPVFYAITAKGARLVDSVMTAPPKDPAPAKPKKKAEPEPEKKAA